MKVLHTCLSLSWGGMEMYSLQTAKLLLNAGIDVEMLCYPGSRLYIEAFNHGIKVYPFRFRKRFHLIQILKLSRMLREKHFDLIHSEASKDLWLIVPALKLSGMKTPLVLTKHIGSFISKKDFLHEWIYKRVNIAIAISSVIKRNLLETTHLKAGQITLLHDSVDTARFDPDLVTAGKVRSEFGVKDHEILIGMTSRFSPGKGHEDFLFAANQLSRRYDYLKFIIIGEPSRGEEDYGTEIKNLTARFEHSEKFIFTGFRGDIPEILAAIDIFVFPSHAEAFGLALVEAMSMRKPSVCSNSDGVLDIAVNGDTSFLYEKENVGDLIEKLEKFILNPLLRKMLGLNARERVLRNFNTDIFTAKIIDIYNGLNNR